MCPGTVTSLEVLLRLLLLDKRSDGVQLPFRTTLWYSGPNCNYELLND